jgi:hypothetical protein
LPPRGGLVQRSPSPTEALENMRVMTTIDRTMPPLQADERATLEGWLDF